MIALDLGDLDVVSQGSRIKLHLTCRANLVPSEDFDARILLAALKSTSADSNSFRRAWIHCHGRFGFEIALQAEPSLRPEQDGRMMDVLAKRLQKSQLWSDLHFLPKCVRTSSNGYGKYDVLWMDLVPDHLQNKTQCPTNMLAKDTPIHDHRAPLHVPSIALDSVRFDITLSSSPCTSARKPRDLSSKPLSPNNHGSEPEEMLEPLEVSDGPYEMVSESQTSVSEHHMKFNTPWTPSHTSLDYTDMMLDEASAQNCALSGTPAPGSSQQQDGSPDVAIETLVDLVDIALSHVCCGPSKEPRRDGLIQNDTVFPKLPQLAPSIWSPGYLPALAQRAAFLPTISHALTNVTRRRSCSNHLLTKIRDIVQKEEGPGPGIRHDGRADDEPAHAQTMLHARLWRTMRHTLHKAKSSQRAVKMLSPSREADAAVDVMLEPNLCAVQSVNDDDDADDDYLLLDDDFNDRVSFDDIEDLFSSQASYEREEMDQQLRSGHFGNDQVPTRGRSETMVPQTSGIIVAGSTSFSGTYDQLSANGIDCTGSLEDPFWELADAAFDDVCSVVEVMLE